MNIPTWAKMGLVGAGGAGIAGAIHAPEDRSDQNEGYLLQSAGLAGAVGGLAGAAIIPGLEGIVDIGKKIKNAGENEYNILKQPGAIKKVLDQNTDFVFSAAGKAASLGVGAASVPVGVTKAVADGLLKDVDKDAGSLLNTKFNKKGKLLMAGVAFMSAVNEGFNAYNESRKGVSTGRMLTPTPSFMEEQRQVMQNRLTTNAEAYGAGGDLVFALNRNRQG